MEQKLWEFQAKLQVFPWRFTYYLVTDRQTGWFCTAGGTADSPQELYCILVNVTHKKQLSFLLSPLVVVPLQSHI